MTRAERLREGYYALLMKQQSAEVRAELAKHFEFAKWVTVGKSERRDGADGWKLLVDEPNGQIEACVFDPAGKCVAVYT